MLSQLRRNFCIVGLLLAPCASNSLAAEAQDDYHPPNLVPVAPFQQAEWFQFGIAPPYENHIGFARLDEKEGELCTFPEKTAEPYVKRVSISFSRRGNQLIIPQSYHLLGDFYEPGQYLQRDPSDVEMPAYLTKVWPLKANATRPEDVHFDQLSREEALVAEEEFAHNEGRISAIIKTTDLAAVRNLFEDLGDGVAIDDTAWEACGAPAFWTAIEVPRGLEHWYARKLERDGLAISATWKSPPPERNGGWSSIALVSNSVVAAWFDPRVTIAQKNEAIGVGLRDALLRFARSRRPNFSLNGTVLRRQGGTRNVWRFEIIGRSIAECTRQPRWEKIQIDFFVVGASRATGLAIDANTIAGYYAPGLARPSDGRFSENEYDDATLARFQEMLFGHLLTSGFRPTEDTEAVAARATQCRT